MNRAKTMLPLCLGVSLTACVTFAPADLQRAVDRVDAVWRAENSRTLGANGSRVVKISRNNAIKAGKHALEQIGLNIAYVDSAEGVIRAERMLKEADISEKVRSVEEPRLKRIVAEELGMMGNAATLQGQGYRLNITGHVKQADGGVRVTISRVWMDYFGDASAHTTQLPPAALKAGMHEFWKAFEANVVAIRAEQSVVTDSRKEPSDWILPPSDN